MPVVIRGLFSKSPLSGVVDANAVDGFPVGINYDTREPLRMKRQRYRQGECGNPSHSPDDITFFYLS
jgi:hypothetical protein